MSFVRGRKQYPLRPEYIESLWYFYKSTRLSLPRNIAYALLQRIEKNCKAKCGYADIADVETLEQADSMQSFFLSETLKYYYLIFGKSEFDGIGWMMTTEAHFLPITRETVKLGPKFQKKVSQKCKDLFRKKSQHSSTKKEKFDFYNAYVSEIRRLRYQLDNPWNTCKPAENPARKFPLDCNLEALDDKFDLGPTGECFHVNWIISKELSLHY